MKKSTIGLLAVCALVLVGVAWYYVRQATTTDEDRVRAVIGNLVSSIEDDNLVFATQGIRANLASDYRHTGEGRSMAITKQTAIWFVTNLKSSLHKFEVEIRAVTITVEGPHAEAVVTGRITAERRDAPGTRIEVMTQPGRNRAMIELRKDDGEWRVIASKRLDHRLD